MKKKLSCCDIPVLILQSCGKSRLMSRHKLQIKDTEHVQYFRVLEFLFTYTPHPYCVGMSAGMFSYCQHGGASIRIEISVTFFRIDYNRI